jgi:hypothetical protein
MLDEALVRLRMVVGIATDVATDAVFCCVLMTLPTFVGAL